VNGMTYIEELEAEIRMLHGLEATHRESVPVKEFLDGNAIWEGTVEVFDLHAYSNANRAYAWSQETNDPSKPKRHIVVLHVPPAVSPETAVRASILEEFKKSSSGA